MSALDISRYLDQPEKHYSGLVRHQGAIITDSDENERDLILQQNLRGVLADAIGANGTPNDGFKVNDVQINGSTFDLRLLAGTFFLGGNRYEAPADFDLGEQLDWLQFDDMHGLPEVPAPGEDHCHLVWLEAWEQTVAAREDSELLEAALNGVDTSGRVRRMGRVHVTQTPQDSCRDAFADLISELEAEGAAFDPDQGCLTGTTRLQVTPDASGASDDLCAPRNEGGYLGADNETIRIQIVEPGTFIWGLSNASPIYRVQAEMVDGQRRQIRMMTLPWDQVAQPKVGDVVEIIRWGAQLPNEEKVAEETGFFTRVSRSWQRSDSTLLLEDPVPTAWHNWLSDPQGGAPFQSSRDEGEAKTYFYMRVWRGAVFDEGEAGIDFAPGNDIELERTGVKVRFNAAGRTGDYWVFSVRPNTPHEIMPWSFQKPGGEVPTGPRRFLSVLAHLDWSAVDEDGASPKIDDCRRRFRPLSHASSCCEITVGDGVNSHGDVTSVQQAIDMLPPTGGKVCVLKGEFEEAFSVNRKENVIIEGCGVLTRVRLPADVNHTLVGINNSRNITLRSMTLTVFDEIAVTVTGSNLDSVADEPRAQDITLEHLTLHARDASAVFASPVQRFRLSDCRIVLAGLDMPITPSGDNSIAPGQMPGVVIGGKNLEVLDCRIGSTETRLPLRPFGGIHVLGGSQIVRIRRNTIRQISGLGVALGSWSFVKREEGGGVALAEIGMRARVNQSYRRQFHYGVSGTYNADRLVLVTDDGCPQADPQPERPDPGDDDDPEFEVDTGDPVQFIQINDNEFYDTGLSGIGVIRFFDLEEFPAVIAVRGIDICNNKIIRPAQFELPLLSGSRAVHTAYGGITLGVVDSGTILENVISEAGGNDLDPYCGVFILKANGLAIERNTITENGGELIHGGPIRLGQRGGVIIAMASTPQMNVPFGNAFGLAEYSAKLKARRAPLTIQAGIPALRFHDNVVVQPDGRALQCLADGPISVCNNQLVSRGAAVQSQWLSLIMGQLAGGVPSEGDLARIVDTFDTDSVAAFLALFGGLCVNIMCIPGSADALARSISSDPAAVGQFDTKAAPLSLSFLFYHGEVMLNDNQITFDAKDALIDVGMSSISVIGADDTSICNNQCQADILRNDRLAMAQLMAITLESARVSNNYVKQPGVFGFNDPSATDPVSIFSFALTNTTSMNHYSGRLQATGLRVAQTDNVRLVL